VCPLITFKSEALVSGGENTEMTCYTEGILSLNLIVYKDPELGGYVLTPEFSRFRNQLVRSQFEQLYTFIWVYSETNIAYSDQRSFNLLV
jgi:hypothetical protein